jgi:hypothetical protein
MVGCDASGEVARRVGTELLGSPKEGDAIQCVGVTMHADVRLPASRKVYAQP